ncbi:MAG: hypothetical protein HY671_11820 [Chloroflexi bacterium]|nr:hypothetical protein [Chloroflexota bacterium]
MNRKDLVKQLTSARCVLGSFLPLEICDILIARRLFQPGKGEMFHSH